MHKRIDWSDLRFVLAVAEHGSLAAAAKALGVSYTTVLRRLDALEEAQGLRLFERLAGGYALTAAGEEMVTAAQSIDDVVNALERRLSGQDLRLEGLVRLTTTDTLMRSLLAPILRDFRQLHPGITLEVSVATAMANLTRRDADVAIRATASLPDTLVGRRIAPIGYAVYGAAAQGQDVDYLSYDGPWVGPGDLLAETVVARWMRTHIPAARTVVRADTLTAMADAAAAGLGVAALPCYLGDATGALSRMSGVIDSMPRSELWVLTHQDLRRTARIRVFTSFVAAALAQRHTAIEGRATVSGDSAAGPAVGE